MNKNGQGSDYETSTFEIINDVPTISYVSLTPSPEMNAGNNLTVEVAIFDSDNDPPQNLTCELTGNLTSVLSDWTDNEGFVNLTFEFTDLNPGDYYFNITCNDGFNYSNVWESNVNVTNEDPEIFNIHYMPTEPIPGGVVTINASVNDSDTQQGILCVLDGTHNNLVGYFDDIGPGPNNTIYAIFNITAPESYGTFDFNISCSDSYSQIYGFSSLTVPNHYPVIEHVYTTPKSPLIAGQDYTITVNVSDQDTALGGQTITCNHVINIMDY